MRVYHFTEQPYPDAWHSDGKSLRVTLPNRECDPEVMAGLYERYFDEWLLADELGLDIMVNEHHSTATCLSSMAVVPMSILARQTKRARLLTLGYPIANRLDPVRVAEEFAMIDVISRGRLEMGLVRGVPYELAVTPKSAVGMIERFWEAHDLIIKALSTRDGPFSWEGKHFQARNVNVWPRPYQDPHPPVWISGRSPANIRDIASRGHVFATFLSGAKTADMFDYYRKVCVELGRPTPGADRLAYLGIVAVADTHRKAMQRANILVDYMRTSSIVAAPFNMPPGYMRPVDAVKMMRTKGKRTAVGASGKAVDVYKGSIEELIDANVMFVGTPDEVYRQIAGFDEKVGGLGHLLMMGHAANLSHEDTVDNITLFAKEVLPRLQELSTATDTAEERAERAAL